MAPGIDGRPRSDLRASGKSSKRSKFLSACMLLLGLGLSTNVVYVFRIGSTCVYVGYAIALLLVIWLFLSNRGEGGIDLGLVDSSVWIFFTVACVSVIAAAITSITGGTGVDAPLVALRGLVVLFCGILTYYVVVRLSRYSKSLLIGLGLGIAINGVLCLVQYYAFYSGSVFTLYNYFPQESFAVFTTWDAASAVPIGASAIYSFRPQGLFLEPSHIMIFLVCLAPIAFLTMKSRIGRLAIVGTSVFCCVTALSPNAIFFLIEVLVLLAVYLSHNGGKNHLSSARFSHGTIIAAFAIVLAATVFLMVDGDVLNDIVAALAQSLTDLDVSSTTDTGTLDRWNSMVKALAVCGSNLFGTGWNTEALTLSYIYGSGDVASQSYAIRLLLETGVLGLVSYALLIWRHSKPLLGGESMTDLCLCAGVVFLAICQVTNGMTLVPWAWALLGLARSRALRRGAHAAADWRPFGEGGFDCEVGRP